MRWRNSTRCWGIPQILMHWSVVLTIIGLFGLGLWMTGLDYYSPWYQTAPDLHRGIGLLLLALMLFHLLWRLLQPVPKPLPTHSATASRLAHVIHGLLYLLVAEIIISGYLISTADGRPVDVLGWFQVPALLTDIEDQEQLMGRLHETFAWTLAILVGLHAGGALKHHLFDHDITLTRMLGRCQNEETPLTNPPDVICCAVPPSRLYWPAWPPHYRPRPPTT